MQTITYTPFLRQVVAYLNSQTAVMVEQCFIVFPTALSIDYFQSLWYDRNPSSLPTCLTLDQLIQNHSGLSEAPTITLLHELYLSASQLFPKPCSFEQFYPFGKILLQDFNDLDQYRIPATDCLLQLNQQKQSALLLNLGAPQHAFESKSKWETLFQQQEPLLPWEQLPLLYQIFTEKLFQKGKGYKGLCYKIASDKPVREPFASELIFAGFNLLTPAEEAFIAQIQAKIPLRFYWDSDPHYMDNPLNVAGNYLRQHQQKPYFQNHFPKVSSSYFHDKNKAILVTEVDATLIQIQSIVERLQAVTAEGKAVFPLPQTAIVLSGNQLLVPLLDRLAALAIPLHGRLAYPLNATLIYTAVVSLTEYWMESSNTAAPISHNLKRGLRLLQPFVEDHMQTKMKSLVKALPEYITHAALCREYVGPLKQWLSAANKGLLDFLKTILRLIATHFVPKQDLFLDINKTALQHILDEIAAFYSLAEANNLAAVFLNFLKESSLSFHQYNPLTGLYIIEVTESHNLDFEQLFFIDMAEGSFPTASQSHSLLPYNLRQHVGLPLRERVMESITAYGFYRLLQRSQHNYCSYTKQDHGKQPAEISRLLLQLSFDSKLNITQRLRSSCYAPLPIAPISMEKDAAIMQLLAQFVVKGHTSSASLTASALIAYLSCPLQFYFRYLLQIKPMPQEKEAAVTVGQLLHKVMAQLYRPFVDKQLTKETLHHIASKIKQETALACSSLTGQTAAELTVYTALLEKMLERLLTLDETMTPFTLLGVEIKKKQNIFLHKEQKIALSGVVDRIDHTTHGIRIVDYKTGIANDRIPSIAALFNRATVKNNSAIFQLFLYAWLVLTEGSETEQQIVIPYLISIRSLFLDGYVPAVSIQSNETKAYERIEDVRPFIQVFEKDLRSLLVELFNPTVPFTQTEDRELCSYCSYAAICRRN
ncbi:PD-(D/E)XK nuclease family protein [Candidatus Cardinium hertigii]|uniref:ATP-dependent helicase/deoxyribonuclease subunit B n=1 Tax=Candidatus Cardinium hertigii TaxID=247481 RepID=A0A2Z3LH23_9BACT|nr:PD-(D/E)XK nuclease family protein [Candidatus Cardinium hertigii]AWN81724.1 ATP-dependent helicase/deoxyribonuclease subunit B [Candidatus Cardinium hertigii]